MTEKINELVINCKLKGMREGQKRGREKGRNNENKEGYFPWKGGGVLNKVKYGEVPPPYPFIYHFGTKGTPFIYLLLKKGTPFTYLSVTSSYE